MSRAGLAWRTAAAAVLTVAALTVARLDAPASSRSLPNQAGELGVAAVLENVRLSGQGEPVERSSYALPNAQAWFGWPDGVRAGGAAEGVTGLAIPEVVRGASPSEPTTRLIPANLVPRPGFTDFVVYWNRERLADFACQKLSERQSDEIGGYYLNPGFVGSATISASFWEHDVFNPEDGRFQRNVVGLAAVAESWPDEAATGNDLAYAVVAAPLYRPWTPVGDAYRPLCPRGPRRGGPPPAEPTSTPTGAWSTPSATPTAPPTPTRPGGSPYNPASPQIRLPAVNRAADGMECAAQISVQNAGNRPAVAVLLIWSSPTQCAESCAGPRAILCSGPIQPGSAWQVPAGDIPADAASAVVYSFDPEGLASAGQPCADPADCACPFSNLFGSVLIDCAGYASFDAAYSGGQTLAGVDLGLVTGPPLAATVRRACPTGPDGVGAATDAYAGPSGPLQGDIARADGLGSGAYVYDLAWLEPLAALHIQNAGRECALVSVLVTARDDCAPDVETSVQVAAGQSAIVTLPQGPGAPPSDTRAQAGVVTSSQPLAIVVEHRGQGGLASYSGEAHAPRDASGELALGPRRDVAFAPSAHAGRSGWWSTLHVQNTGDEPQQFLVTLIDRDGDTRLQRTLGPACQGAAVVGELRSVAALLPCGWLGSIRVEAFPASVTIDVPPWPETGSVPDCPVVPTVVPTASSTPGGPPIAWPTSSPWPTPTPLGAAATPSATPDARVGPEPGRLWLPALLKAESH